MKYLSILNYDGKYLNGSLYPLQFSMSRLRVGSESTLTMCHDGVARDYLRQVDVLC